MEVTHPKTKHTHTIINLHGRGSNASEYRAEFEESETSNGLTLKAVFPGVKWVYPTAQINYATRFGEDMSQWFDMWKTEDPHERSDGQAQTLKKSATDIKQLVLEEAEEIGLQNVILCGISQGAATAITVLLEMNERLAGFVGFAAWLPAYASPLTALSHIGGTPVFLAHCADDETIAIRYGRELKEYLGKLEVEVTWREYGDGGHWINERQGVHDVVQFLNGIMR